MRDVLRLKHYSYRAEQTYCDWVKRLSGFTVCGIRATWAKRR
jgi:hypothetical protein